MANSHIFEARSEADIRRCHAVMHELRPHLAEEPFVQQVLRQQEQGFRLAALEAEGSVRAVTGFRLQEMLAHGRILYVDDLVTAEKERSSGWGEQLFQWLLQQAREGGCAHLQLDSGSWRHGAHRFYFRQGMHISSYHFTMPC
ncbi:GNAT family N-acetyltransferase [Cesiribacter andamanensis]|uniref:Aminoalkylphosphonic acid N-acetyltransferase n=1 Tax=Cesiribacter andamanensis AMV16 TaxID=1279009 RepID=M7MY09_9BACT|nr:GNAT family N-acetyltransferase [Cesiribacter andamanensis]EMR01318.1 aminoalkylphosphonic acid N-acetyltransferase [Cesiribacter andamanensis AMV16]